MADLAITASQVKGSGLRQSEKSYLAGVAITAGQVVYLDANNVWQLAGANIAAAGGPNVRKGIAENAAAAGQPVSVCYSDPTFTLGAGAGMTVGAVYMVSATPGNLMPAADLGAGNYPTVLLVATSASQGILSIVAGSAAHA